MQVEYGLLFFVIGMTVTIIGFFIAFLVATYKPKKAEEEDNALTQYHKDIINKK